MDTIHKMLLPRRYGYQQCTDVTPECPVWATTYTYYPNLAANVFFLVYFFIIMVLQIILGLRFKTWTFLIGLGIGTFGEGVGYIGRVIMHHNPWSQTGFEMQICCIIISPAFIAAGIYLMLKHVVIQVGPTLSRLPARWYTWIFILCDCLSLVLQAAGGGTAASAHDNYSLAETGDHLMMAGICFQVLTLLLFGALVIDYVVGVLRHVRQINRNGGGGTRSALSPSAYALLATKRFRLFLVAMTLAYLTVLIRCVYRIVEMEKGWGRGIMTNEADFIALDGVMIAIAVLCLTVAHPGIAFPEMLQHSGQWVEGTGYSKKSEHDETVEQAPRKKSWWSRRSTSSPADVEKRAVSLGQATPHA